MAEDHKHNFSAIEAAILGSLSSDAYSLSYHWVYDISQIPHPLPAHLKEPAAQFHKGKEKGDTTHTGDQGVLLLEAVADKKQFDLADYAQRFQKLFDDHYKGWKTHYCKEVLKQLQEKTPVDKVGSAIEDTDPVGRIGALLLAYKNVKDFSAVAQKYSAFTNRSARVQEVTDYISHVLFKVLDGKKPVAAIEETLKEEPFKNSKSLVDSVHTALASVKDDTAATIAKYGQNCNIGGGFIGAIHLIAKHESDLAKANEANVAAGGDSAGRGMVVGLILGAHLGAKGLPAYTKEMKAYPEVVKLLASFH